MARTKSTESTSSENSKHERSPAEQAAVATYFERAKQHAPQLKVSHDDGIVKIAPDHRDPELGTVLLMNALGTADEALFKGLVLQLSGLATAKLPEEIELKESELNFALSVVQAVKPRDAVEALLASQMVAVHNATMTAAWRLAKSENIPQRDSAATVLNKCARTFAAQLEVLKKYRSNGEQIVKVQHVNVNGGQAIVTDTLQTGGGGYGKIEHQSHESGAAAAPSAAVQGHIQALGPDMSGRSDAGPPSMLPPRGARRSANGQS
jgi:hypothetical protein